MFSVNVDISQLNDLLEIGPALKKVADDAAQELSKMVIARAKEQAALKLKTRRQMYQDGLFIEKIEDGAWFVCLKKKVRWIDDGQSSFDMLKGLLNSPKAKQGKNGKYIVVPFQHGPKGSAEGGNTRTGNTEAQQDLVGAVKQELKARGIPFGKNEKGADGKDLMGRLHTFNVTSGPPKKDPGPGQRRGPVGETMQGNTGTPFLHGVTVHQFKDKAGKTQRSILTFRVATEKQGGGGKWEHPGNPAVNILEKAAEEAVELWTKEIAPMILDKALSDL